MAVAPSLSRHHPTIMASDIAWTYGTEILTATHKNTTSQKCTRSTEIITTRNSDMTLSKHICRAFTDSNTGIVLIQTDHYTYATGSLRATIYLCWSYIHNIPIKPKPEAQVFIQHRPKKEHELPSLQGTWNYWKLILSSNYALYRKPEVALVYGTARLWTPACCKHNLYRTRFEPTPDSHHCKPATHVHQPQS